MKTKPQITLLLLTLLFLAISSILYGKSVPRPDIKFGKVSIDELTMTNYELDSSASAVILFDYGKFSINDYRFTRHLRIKVLNKAGLSWANQTFNTPSKSSFKVQVHNYENNSIVTEKANSDNIFEEEIFDNFSIQKVFAPNVRVGSIIDIQYSFYGLPNEWRFQEVIPVVYSELEIQQSSNFSYNKFSFGFEKIEEIDENRWRAVNVPAFKSEPFVNSYKNYITKFRIQLTWVGRSEISSSWDVVSSNLLKSYRFGGILEESRYLNEAADSINALGLNPTEKLKSALNYIKENIKWDNSKRLFASSDYKTKFKKFHSGNSADVNLHLVSLLSRMDFEAYPLALSTRDNGMILEYQPTISHLNYSIAFVRLTNDKYILIDATSEDASIDILPERCLNGKGLLVGKDRVEWISLNSRYSYDKSQFALLNLNEDLEFSGQMSVKHKGLEFISWCQEQDENNDDSEKYLDKIKEDFQLDNISNHVVSQKNLDNHIITEKFELDLENKVIDGGNTIIIFPVVMYDYDKNPFKSDTRLFPIDLTSTKSYSHTTLLNIPQNAQIVSVPQSVKFMNSDASASFQYLISKSPAGLQIKIDLAIDKSVFMETEYPELKEFFSQVSKTVNQPIEIVL